MIFLSVWSLLYFKNPTVINTKTIIDISSSHQIENKIEETIKEIQLNVPQDVDSSFKSYMDYRAITDVNSDQWELQNKAYTDKTGIRKIDNYYCVALGSYYTQNIGEKFKVLLDNGNTIYVITSDIKQDIHTNSTNQYKILNEDKVNIIEFIVDINELEEMAKIMGDISYIEGDMFDGEIVEIIKLEENL